MIESPAKGATSSVDLPLEWPALSALRWGPGLLDDEPGIDIYPPQESLFEQAIQLEQEYRQRRIAKPVSDSVGRALQYLVGYLAVKPSPLRKVLEGADEFRISHRAVFTASEVLEVIKTSIDGEEVWDLEQGVFA